MEWDTSNDGDKKNTEGDLLSSPYFKDKENDIRVIKQLFRFHGAC